MVQPDIIFIMADDMGYGDVAHYNPQSKIPTPNMDRLAHEGTYVTDAHSASAVCTPSRYAVITGRYCWRSPLQAWVLHGFGAPIIEPDRPTVASMLKQHGYTTAAVGKWHLGLNWTASGEQSFDTDHGTHEISRDGFDVDYSQPLTGGPTDLGFDYFFGISGSLDMPPYCFIENDRTVGIPTEEKHLYYNQQRKGMMTSGWRDDEVDTTFASKAVAFIEEQQTTDTPFFLYLAPASPHRPCDIRPDFVIGKSEAGDRGDMVYLFDWVVGQVLDALDRTGQADNTLVIVTSDNGARLTCADGSDYGHKSNGDLRGQKADIWDGGHREPFIVRWPGVIPAGIRSDALICLSDLMATCAGIVDAEIDAEDSVDFLPALTGEFATVRETLVHHSGAGMFSVRQGPWKLVLGLGSGGFSDPRHEDPQPGGPQGQLYNLDDDPAETRNLWSAQPDKVAEMTALLESISGRDFSVPPDVQGFNV
jgi:arylsulfatase A